MTPWIALLVVMGMLWGTVGAVRGAAVPELGDAERAIEQAMANGDVPGAVLLVGDRSGVRYLKAFGQRGEGLGALKTDAVFDLASLTKPVATATSVLVLVDEGKVKLGEKVSVYLPEFTGEGKEKITVEQLLRHRGGLIADNPLADYQNGPEAAWKAICGLKLRGEPGTRFEYSDVGFIVLGELVERVSGKPLGEFVADQVLRPLKMNRTAMGPLPAEMAAQAVPTEKREGKWMQGEVHDPRAFLMGGSAGHAGLFGTAEDVAVWVRMVLGGGAVGGERVLKQETAAAMVRGARVPGGAMRGLGVDVDSSFSPAPRGSAFPIGSSFGHTGFTGTSFWADPGSGVFYVLLTSRLHPDGKGDVRALRSAVATAVATEAGLAVKPVVRTGIDVLERDGFKALQGKRAGLITNHSGRNLAGSRTVDVLLGAKDGEAGVKLVRLFSPEHGLFGVLDEKVGHGVDEKTGLKVFSLYGEHRKPTPEMLEGLDVLVFDIQDAGARFYTYSATLGLAMEAAAEAGLEVVVLDRPNPITGLRVDGPVAEKEFYGFTAYGPMPVAHGMTLGELAQLYTSEWNEKPRLAREKLTVVPMEGWSRGMWFDETNLVWVNPSPNLRNLTQATLYPGICLLEAANVSVGRGTDEPFSTIGAPWIDGKRLAAALNAEGLPGVRFVPIEFVPTSSKFKDQLCRGVYVVLTDRQAFEPVRTGLVMAWHLRQIYGDVFEYEKVVRLLQNRRVLDAVREAKSTADFASLWKDDVARFMALRERFLLYR